MTSRTFCRVTVALVAFLFLSSLLPFGTRTRLIGAAPAEPAPGPSQAKSTAPPPIPAADLISAQDLAKILPAPPGEKPLLFYIGFRFACTQAHTP